MKNTVDINSDFYRDGTTKGGGKMEHILFILRRDFLNGKVFYVVDQDSEHLFDEVMKDSDAAEVVGDIKRIEKKH